MEILIERNSDPSDRLIVDVPNETAADVLASWLPEFTVSARKVFSRGAVEDAPAPAKRERKARTEKPAADKKPRAVKVDDAVIASVLANLAASTAKKAGDIIHAAGVDEKAGKKAIAQLVADGRAVQHGKARGTTYSLATGAQS